MEVVEGEGVAAIYVMAGICGTSPQYTPYIDGQGITSIFPLP